MRRNRLAACLFTGLALVGSVGRTATIAPPENLGALARMSTAVVLAEALDSTGVEAGATRIPGPYTLTRFRLLEQVGGVSVGKRFDVVEPGGVLGSSVMTLGGVPRYEVGRTYLLFLDLASGGYWRSRMLAYGLLVEDPVMGLLEPLPEVGSIETVGEAPFEAVEAYRKETLVGHLRDVMHGAAWNRERAGSVPALAYPLAAAQAPAGCDYLTSSSTGLPFRWFGWETGSAGPSVVRPTTPGQDGIIDGGVSAVVQGASAWRNHPASLLRLDTAGTIPESLNCAVDPFQPGAVVFNDPCKHIAPMSGCTGTLALGGHRAFFATENYDGMPWHPAVPGSAVVLVNAGAQCIGETAFKEMMTHELGHTLSFGHHAATPAPNPTMSAFLKNDDRGATLVGRDRPCASFAYHTFLDVPFANPFWSFVQAVANGGVTGGCQPGRFCPSGVTNRGSMAVFLLRAKNGPAYNPPPCTPPGPFNDVPCSNGFAAWIQELVAQEVTSGCGGGAYCPSALVTRGQMAVFLLRTLEGPSYTPDACTSSPFGDVPAGSPLCPWIRELVDRGITSGCGGGSFCPNGTTTRAPMAAFLTTTFGLTIPQ